MHMKSWEMETVVNGKPDYVPSRLIVIKETAMEESSSNAKLIVMWTVFDYLFILYTILEAR